MFKGKISVWAVVLVVSICLNFAVTNVPKWFESYDISMSVEVSDDINLSNLLNKNSVENINISITNTSPDIIIADAGKYQAKEGYVKYSNLIYTPLVLYTRSAVTTNNSGFSSIETSSSTPYRVDLRGILLGIENNEEWKSIGVSNKVIKGPICLWIPDKNSPYYKNVVELFKMTLKDDNTDSEVDLDTRVNNIISKCVQVTDIHKEIEAEVKSTSTNYKVFIGPEYLFVRGSRSIYSKEYSDRYIPVYFNDTSIIYKDVFIKNTEGNTNQTTVGNFVKYMTEKSSFMSKSGYRVENMSFDVDRIHYSLINYI